jgi:hypothetical protein
MNSIEFANSFYSIFRKYWPITESISEKSEEILSSIFHEQIDLLKEQLDQPILSFSQLTGTKSDNGNNDKSAFKHLHAALSHIQYTFECVSSFAALPTSVTEAIKHMKNANENATKAFFISLRHDEKIIASRIRFFATVYSAKFEHLKNQDRQSNSLSLLSTTSLSALDSAEEECVAAFNDFLAIPHINLIVRTNSEPSDISSSGRNKFGTSADRLEVVREINSLVNFVEESSVNWKLSVGSGDDIYDLSLSKEKAIYRGHNAPIKVIAVKENTLFTVY